MPIHSKDELVNNKLSTNKKGDLYIRFDIKFPIFIQPNLKDDIVEILKEAK